MEEGEKCNLENLVGDSEKHSKLKIQEIINVAIKITLKVLILNMQDRWMLN